MVVDKGSHKDQHMEQLVALEPDVTFARQPPLRNTEGVDGGAQDVEPSHGQHVGEGAQVPRQAKPVQDDKVNHWQC